MDYEIVSLPPGQYTINVIGLYVNEGDDSLKFTVNLSTEPEGSYCVERQYYPWGTYPTGELINHSGCLTGAADRDTLDQDCLIYEYDGVSTLHIRHVNDLFNCCPDYLYANITIDNNYIYIEEWEAIGPSGGCDCICLYELEYEIVNLPPGEYTVEVNNPHYYNTYGGGQSIGFTGEFWEATSGVVCVDRPYLPWWR